ncbi:MAG TPA: restriction endonuclease [Roseiflexaceae bacterium]|nr:restriction endonuclease [Roseiflexaceae bacterium]
MPTHSESDLRRQIKARLLALPPRAFELFAGDLLEFMGLRDVSVTRYSGDGGLDAVGNLETSASLISIPAGVQVKRYRANVQRADIDRFIGALSGLYPQGIFITTAGYTRQAALKAAAGVPRVATVDGEQVVALMLRHRLGVAELAGVPIGLDEEYFALFEAQASASPQRMAERPEAYRAAREEGAHVARPEDDLISLRALSHALRVDTGALRRWIERGRLRPDQPGVAARGGYFFRRDRVAAIRAELLGRQHPASPEAWRQEFLDFARSRNLTRSYKPVLLKALIEVVNREGEAHIAALAEAFRAFYLARRRAGLPVEFGPPDPSDTQAMSDAQLRRLIVRHPLERFLIKGFLEYLPDEGVVRFAPQLWSELRFWELLDIQRSADEQLDYYYNRPR